VYASQYYINPSTFAPAGEEDSGATWHRHWEVHSNRNSIV
jgi:hypothetical protein